MSISNRGRVVRVVCLTVAMAIIGTVGVHRIALASCAAQQEDGTWINTDPNTRSFPQAQLRFVCQDQVLNGQLYPPGPPWYVHLWGKCHPTNCDWGEVGAQRLGSGHVFAFYDQGFAKRHIWARMSQFRPGQLWVFAWTDFTDPNRADYGVHNWFARQ